MSTLSPDRRPLILLNLDNRISEFSLRQRQVDHLRAVLLGLEVEAVHSVDELLERLPQAEYAATWRFPASGFERAVRLKALFTPAAGHENVAIDPSGRVPTIYGSFHGRLMAESLLAMILHFNRRIPLLEANQRRHAWDPAALGDARSLAGQRALIVGYGNIGKACGDLLAKLGCRITGVRRSPASEPSTSAARPPGAPERVATPADLLAELPEADHLVFALPGGEETEAIFTMDHFRAMKRGAFLYNLGRGNCYHEEDLLAALSEGIVAGAGLDVFAREPLPEDSPLWELPNVLVMPHASAIFVEYMDFFVEELIGHLRALGIG